MTPRLAAYPSLSCGLGYHASCPIHPRGRTETCPCECHTDDPE